MAERALRWTDDELFPRVAVRQLVLTVPWPRRLLLAQRPELARGVLHCALDGLYVAQADGTPPVPTREPTTLTALVRCCSPRR
ncbi:MAG: hypothetical protein ACJAZO_003253 [Myxococcota bacterium]|jgi:hypothetical protein